MTSDRTPCQPPSRLKRWSVTVVHHLKAHTGIGAICSVAYFDPYASVLGINSNHTHASHVKFVIPSVAIGVSTSKAGHSMAISYSSSSSLLEFSPLFSRFVH